MQTEAIACPLVTLGLQAVRAPQVEHPAELHSLDPLVGIIA